MPDQIDESKLREDERAWWREGGTVTRELLSRIAACRPDEGDALVATYYATDQGPIGTLARAVLRASGREEGKT